LNDVNYSSHHEPAAFDDWLQTLRDKVGQRQILARLTRLSLGNWGLQASWRRCGELGIDSGPGYGAYCWRDGDVVVVALGGGDKSTQQKDIAKAQAMAKELKG
jgi:putative addiction module killer protein